MNADCASTRRPGAAMGMTAGGLPCLPEIVATLEHATRRQPGEFFGELSLFDANLKTQRLGASAHTRERKMKGARR